MYYSAAYYRLVVLVLVSSGVCAMGSSVFAEPREVCYESAEHALAAALRYHHEETVACDCFHIPVAATA